MVDWKFFVTDQKIHLLWTFQVNLYSLSTLGWNCYSSTRQSFGRRLKSCQLIFILVILSTTHQRYVEENTAPCHCSLCWSNSLIPVLTKSTGVLKMCTWSVLLDQLQKKVPIQISTDPDESIQPIMNNIVYCLVNWFY